MGLRIKNFNILGVHRAVKNLTFRGEFTKNQYRGGRLPKRVGGLGQFPDLRRGAWQERRGGVFEGRLIL